MSYQWQMKRISHKKWAIIFLIIGVVFLQMSCICYAQDVIEEIEHSHDSQTADDMPADLVESKSEEIQVEDYLESLSLSELDEICQHRGFAVEGSTREDYVNAARRCLSLENEMNAILAANPELAAELEKEIERMKAEKERLEVERQDLLEQISDLQQQLTEAGMNDAALEALLIQHKNPANMTFEEVFKESISQLYDRVTQDVRFVSKLVSPILSPIVRSILGALKFGWRYAKRVLLEVVPEDTRVRLEKNVARFLPIQEWISEGGAIQQILHRAKLLFQAQFIH
ncbi:hypothetical protein FisN_1Lh370 [Fistulifera solaris]|uniref:Uncharacterized protein n=1 Tax=Fistulifera solaris TaxID=1519565 RepID=A0A1Z5K438_FISSO|nr:hypothetical protein FisN_1Lh370 [Fistulifera solaris]|eukprot:GAX20966.1 hypothetical protein FisN_1Lh370 [Fistulifera solaris]